MVTHSAVPATLLDVDEEWRREYWLPHRVVSFYMFGSRRGFRLDGVRQRRYRMVTPNEVLRVNCALEENGDCGFFFTTSSRATGATRAARRALQDGTPDLHDSRSRRRRPDPPGEDPLTGGGHCRRRDIVPPAAVPDHVRARRVGSSSSLRRRPGRRAAEAARRSNAGRTVGPADARPAPGPAGRSWPSSAVGGWSSSVCSARRSALVRPFAPGCRPLPASTGPSCSRRKAR